MKSRVKTGQNPGQIFGPGTATRTGDYNVVLFDSETHEEMMMALTDAKVRTLKTQTKAYKVPDTGGLYLEVSTSGAKHWRFRYILHGRESRITFGKFPDLPLLAARKRRDEARAQLAEGIDPSAERKREKLAARLRAATSFGDIAKEYIDKSVADGRADATIVKANWLLDLLKPVARMPIAEIKPVEILAALKRIEAKGHHESARRCRSFASRVFRYAVATGRGETDPTAVLRGALIVPRTTHHAALVEPEDVGELLRAIDAYTGYAVTRIACQISPHVMLRPGELRKGVWPELDFDKAVWAIPPGRMKMRRPHFVPLSRQVVELFRELYAITGPEGYMFPAFHSTKRPMSENTVNQAFRRMGFAHDEVTAHGLRTTASSLLNESGKWGADAIERSLAHADQNAIRGIYNRGRYWDERVEMHQWWSDYIDEMRSTVPVSRAA